jgi:hypothetical protein
MEGFNGTIEGVSEHVGHLGRNCSAGLNEADGANRYLASSHFNNVNNEKTNV